MLPADQPEGKGLTALGGAPAPPARTGEPAGSQPATSRRLKLRRLVVFAAAFGLPVWMALRNGSYDVVDRQEAGLLVWGLIATGLVVGFFPRARWMRETWPVAIALGALLGFNVLSLLWTGSAERTMDEIARVTLYAGVVLFFLLLVNRHTWRAAAGGIASALAFVTLLAVLSRLFPGAFPETPELTGDRLHYPFGYWNALACWATMTVASGLAWSAHARSAVIRALALASVPLAVAVVYLCYSRGGVVATGIAVLAVVALGRNRWTTGLHAGVAAVASAVAIVVIRGQPEIADGVGDAGNLTVLGVLIAAAAVSAVAAAGSRVAGVDRLRLPLATALATIALAAVVLAGALAVGSEQIGEAVDEFKEGGNPATTRNDDPSARLTSFGGARYDYWDVSLDAFASAGVGGIGPGTFEFYWAREGTSAEFVVDAHSLYLEQLAELGLIGFALLIGLLVAFAAAAAAARRLRGGTDGAEVALLSVFVVWAGYAGFDWIWEMPAITVTAMIAIAVAIASGSARRREARQRPLRLGLLLAALAALAVQVPGIVANERGRAAEQARISGDPEVALELVEDAIDSAPWAATPRHVEALALSDQGRLADADVAIGEAIDREPDNRWHWLVATRIAIDRQRAAEARERFERAIELNGRLPLLNKDLSFLRYELDRQIDELSAAEENGG